jgi:choline-sulfatase
VSKPGRRRFLQSLGAAAASLVVAPFAGAAAGGTAPAAPTAASRRRNVILIVSDEHQAAACGCYGSRVRRVDGLSPTPHIDALAASGVRFDSMYCSAPLCAPSRASYMTGMYPHTTTALHHKMQTREAGLSRFPGVREGIPGMGEYFRRAGYKTAAIGKVHVHGEQVAGWDLGFDERALRFYTEAPGMHYADLKDGDVNDRYRERGAYDAPTYRSVDPVKFAATPADLTVKQNSMNQHFQETLVEHEEEMFDHLVTERSVDFIARKAAAREPFFIHVGLEKPHRPWTVHKKFLDRFAPADMPLPVTIARWVTEGMIPFVQQWCHTALIGDEARRSIAAYYACASQVDDCVGRIVERCRELGILDDTVIIYTSDHGESLYEHGLIEKHNMLDPAARVPFVLRAPWALPQGTTCDAPASLVDIIPTLCELTASPASPALEGVSLLPVIAGRSDPERMVFSEFYQAGSVTRKDEFLPIRMGLNRRHKFIYTHAAADQLYERGTDDETLLRNRAFEPAHEATVSHLKLCTLHDWELDEYPMLDASARVDADGVRLSWESAAPLARYDVYRGDSADPRRAVRVAAGLTNCAWIDTAAGVGSGATRHYWVLAHYHLDQPFVDHRGKARYGDQPILAPVYPRTLPVTPRIEVKVSAGFAADVAYQPLLGCAFGGLKWIHIGMPPQPDDNGARLTGPVTVLSPRVVSAEAFTLSAEMRTPRPGPRADDSVKLLFGYATMHRHYTLGLRRDGTLELRRRTGEKPGEVLASKRMEGAVPAEWHRVEVRFERGDIRVSFDGALALAATDATPHLAGRFGCDVPLHVTEAGVRNVTLA